MSLAEVAAAVGGRLSGADPTTRVTGAVEYDSRKIGPGGLFAAFVGERVDGHDFAGAALDAGAAAVLGTRPLDRVPMVVVGDVLVALGALARTVVDRLAGTAGLTVIGLTGSSGKTTTKDLIAQLAGMLGPTVAPAGSLNNELGYPYTALQAGPSTRFLVLEMGARGLGHLAYLCRVAPPRIGVVLNVGTAHIGEFGTIDAIAAAKGELVEALPADGVAILNGDDPRVAAMATRTPGRVVYFGAGAEPHDFGAGAEPDDFGAGAEPDDSGAGAEPDDSGARVRATEVVLDECGRPCYTLVARDQTVRVRLRLTGEHQVGNSLAVAAVALELGMAVPQVGAALGELRPVSSRRMDVFDRADGVTVIDDSYNANPSSVAAALRALVTLGRGRRTVAVLGYLAELGAHERAGHLEVGTLAAQLGVDRVVAVGDAAAPIHHGAAGQPQWGGESVLVSDQRSAVDLLRRELRGGEVVLVKGSRYRTWDVADWLRTGAAAGPGEPASHHRPDPGGGGVVSGVAR